MKMYSDYIKIKDDTVPQSFFYSSYGYFQIGYGSPQ